MNFIIRGLIIYFVVVVSIRLMGKRQIGQLQPTELVVTILLSEVASFALSDPGVPLVTSVLGVLMFAALEVLFSFINIKSGKMRMLLEGHSVLVVRDGQVLEKNLLLVRYSVDNLLEQLRLKDVFNLADVQYAYVETNGSLSVLLKASAERPTNEDMKIKKEDPALPCLVVCDGDIVERDFSLCSLDRQKLKKLLEKERLKPKDILIMTYSKNGQYHIVPKTMAD